jgi:hypothetical protein
METILVACETIRDEIEQALLHLGLYYKIFWLEGGLHNSILRLQTKVWKVLSEVEGKCDRLLLALGYCGGGLSGLTTGNYETIIPLTDDCLSFLLGSLRARKKASKPVTYFLTEGWLRHENNLVISYEKAVEMFDPEMASLVNHTMLDGYVRLGLLDTKTYDVDKVMQKVKPMANDLGLDIETLPVDYSWLHDFLQGAHDEERFLYLPPNSRLDFSHWNKLL